MSTPSYETKTLEHLGIEAINRTARELALPSTEMRYRVDLD